MIKECNTDPKENIKFLDISNFPSYTWITSEHHNDSSLAR